MWKAGSLSNLSNFSCSCLGVASRLVKNAVIYQKKYIYWGSVGPGFSLDKDGNVSVDSPDCVKALTSVVDMWCMCNGPFLTATRSLQYLWVNPEMHIHRERTNSPSPIRSPLSLMVVWSGSHSAVVFMSAPGTCQPSSCTWCLWTVYISHRTCPVDSPSALWRDKNTNNLSIHTVWCETNTGTNIKWNGEWWVSHSGDAQRLQICQH